MSTNALASGKQVLSEHPVYNPINADPTWREVGEFPPVWDARGACSGRSGGSPASGAPTRWMRLPHTGDAPVGLHRISISPPPCSAGVWGHPRDARGAHGVRGGDSPPPLSAPGGSGAGSRDHFLRVMGYMRRQHAIRRE